jgi:hypothetical protein
VRTASLGVSDFAPSTVGDIVDDVVEDVEGWGRHRGRTIGLLEVSREGRLALELGLLGVCSVRSARLVRGPACELVIKVLGSKIDSLTRRNSREIVRVSV